MCRLQPSTPWNSHILYLGTDPCMRNLPFHQPVHTATYSFLLQTQGIFHYLPYSSMRCCKILLGSNSCCMHSAVYVSIYLVSQVAVPFLGSFECFTMYRTVQPQCRCQVLFQFQPLVATVSQLPRRFPHHSMFVGLTDANSHCNISLLSVTTASVADPVSPWPASSCSSWRGASTSVSESLTCPSLAAGDSTLVGLPLLSSASLRVSQANCLTMLSLCDEQQQCHCSIRTYSKITFVKQHTQQSIRF